MLTQRNDARNNQLTEQKQSRFCFFKNTKNFLSRFSGSLTLNSEAAILVFQLLFLAPGNQPPLPSSHFAAVAKVQSWKSSSVVGEVEYPCYGSILSLV